MANNFDGVPPKFEVTDSTGVAIANYKAADLAHELLVICGMIIFS